MLFNLVCHAACALAILFVLICVSCGLFYLAELADDYASYTLKMIKTFTLVTVALHVLFLLTGALPIIEGGVGLIAHLVYATLLKTYPYCSITDVRAIGSVALCVLSHVLYYKFIKGAATDFFYFIGFFSLFVWLVPLTLFVTINTELPLAGSFAPTSEAHRIAGKATLIQQSVFCVMNEYSHPLSSFDLSPAASAMDRTAPE